MKKIASELLVEGLIDWEVDTIFGLPGDASTGSWRAFVVITARSVLFSSTTKRRRHSWRPDMQRAPGSSESASPPRDQEDFSYSTPFTTQSSITSLSWRSPDFKEPSSLNPPLPYIHSFSCFAKKLHQQDSLEFGLEIPQRTVDRGNGT